MQPLLANEKQSVGDAERMLSFLREHGYACEANYFDIVAGWHKAADGRGLTELQRSKRNYAMLNVILDEWMPWHRENPDLSTIDVNRYYSKKILFFYAQELIIGFFIESIVNFHCHNVLAIYTFCSFILDVCTFYRPVKGICGFSRQTVIAITTNIDSVEFRRRQNGLIGHMEQEQQMMWKHSLLSYIVTLS